MEPEYTKSIKAVSLGRRKFNVSESNCYSYRAFISNFRLYYANSSNNIFDTPLLSKASSPIPLLTSSETEFKYFDIRFYALEYDGSRTVSVDCRFAADSLYFIGFSNSYGAEGSWYFLEDWMPKKKNQKIAVTGLTFHVLRAAVSYRELEKDIPRTDLTIGKDGLTSAILALSRYGGGQEVEVQKRHFLQIAQIICEPIRFLPIYREISTHYEVGVILSKELLDLQTDWGKSCKIYSRNIFNEMLEREEFNMSANDFSMISNVSVIKRIERLIFENYLVGVTVSTSDANREHNRDILRRTPDEEP